MKKIRVGSTPDPEKVSLAGMTWHEKVRTAEDNSAALTLIHVEYKYTPFFCCWLAGLLDDIGE